MSGWRPDDYAQKLVAARRDKVTVIRLVRSPVRQGGLYQFLWHEVRHGLIRSIVCDLAELNGSLIVTNEIGTLSAQFYMQPAHEFLPDRKPLFQVVNHEIIEFFTRQHDISAAPFRALVVLQVPYGTGVIAFLLLSH